MKLLFCLLFCSVGWAQPENARIGFPTFVNHVTRLDGGFSTKLLIENKGSSDRQVHFLAYDADGMRLALNESYLYAAVPAETTIELDLDPFLAQQPDSAYLKEFLPEDISVHVVYQHRNGLGSPAMAPASSYQSWSSRLRFYPGNWQTHFDGIALLNPDQAAAEVWLRQYTFAGALISEQLLSSALEPGQKLLYLVGGPDGSPFENRSDRYFEVQADQLLSMTALRGNVPGQTESNLWAQNLSRQTALEPLLEPFQVTKLGDLHYEVTFIAHHVGGYLLEFEDMTPQSSEFGVQYTHGTWAFKGYSAGTALRFQLVGPDKTLMVNTSLGSPQLQYSP